MDEKQIKIETGVVQLFPEGGQTLVYDDGTHDSLTVEVLISSRTAVPLPANRFPHQRMESRAHMIRLKGQKESDPSPLLSLNPDQGVGSITQMTDRGYMDRGYVLIHMKWPLGTSVIFHREFVLTILGIDFSGKAVYDVHACLKESMMEVLGSEDFSEADRIVQAKCRIDLEDPDALWSRIVTLFDVKCYSITSEISLHAEFI